LIIMSLNVRGRIRLTNGDRLFLVQLYRWIPTILKDITVVRPETHERWHRAGFHRYWRWKSRSLGGRPKIAADLRALIRQMSAENPLGVRRAFMASCSNSASTSLSRAWRMGWTGRAPAPNDTGQREPG